MTRKPTKKWPRSNKGREFEIEPLTREELDRLIAASSRRAATGLRNRALIALLGGAALRISEALAIEARDVDPKVGTVNVRRGKGGKQRIIGAPQWVFDVIDRWMEKRKALGLNGGPIISTLRGGKLSSGYVRSLLPRLGHRAKIQKRVHAHGLRHTAAGLWNQEGRGLSIISGMLGHAKVSTTDHYLRKISPEHLVEEMRKDTWAPKVLGKGNGSRKSPAGGIDQMQAEIARLTEELTRLQGAVKSYASGKARRR